MSGEDRGYTGPYPVLAETPGGHTEVGYKATTGATTSGQTSTGSTASIAIAAATPKLRADIADPVLGSSPLNTSASRTGALPAVSTTPNPLTYKHKGTS